MISRRIFSRLSAAAAAGSAAAVPAVANDNLIRREIQGSWKTLMTFSVPPPDPFPPAFWIFETFFPQGQYISVAALPFTTPGHGSWDTASGMIKTRSKLILLPQLLGVSVDIEITESITLDWGRYTYIGTFDAVFAPDQGSPFTLTGKPAGSRIPPP
jgi:hypothetical protein